MSGVVLNAAFFALSRGLVDWLPSSGDWLFGLGVGVTVIGVLSSILRGALCVPAGRLASPAVILVCPKTAGIAVIALGASLIFREDGQSDLAGLAWTVALIHLAGHALAKGGLFLCADGVYSASGSYRINAAWVVANCGPRIRHRCIVHRHESRCNAAANRLRH